MTTRAGPQLEAEYRRRFNNGVLNLVNGTVGYLDNSPQATISAKGQFDYNDTWRWGFDINRASSADYVRNFRVGDACTATPTCCPARSTPKASASAPMPGWIRGSTRA